MTRYPKTRRLLDAEAAAGISLTAIRGRMAPALEEPGGEDEEDDSGVVMGAGSGKSSSSSGKSSKNKYKTI